MPSAEAERLLTMTDLVGPYAIRVAATVGVADAVAAGAGTAAAVAERTGTDVPAMAALLRLLVHRGLLDEARPGQLALTPLGQLLRADHPDALRSHLDLERAPGHMDAAFAGLLHAVRTGQPGYPAIHGRPFWEAVADDHDSRGNSDEVGDGVGRGLLGRSFDEHLDRWAGAWSPTVASLALWDDDDLVVDVGGGTGRLLAALLEGRPHLRGGLVELPATAARARIALAERSLADRVEVHEGSFLDPLPTGGTTYVLAQVLHDWPDEDAVRILVRCAAAAGPHGRVVIVERLPDDGGHSEDQAEMDLLMLVLFASHERTAAQYVALARRAGLLAGAGHPTDGGMGVIELRPAPPASGAEPPAGMTDEEEERR